MAMQPLAGQGNVLFTFDFRVKPGTGDEFIRLFNLYDYSDANPLHKSPDQVKDGVLCRDVGDPDHFWLVGEWRTQEAHSRLFKEVARHRPDFMKLIESSFAPRYGQVVAATPQAVLNQAAGQS